MMTYTNTMKEPNKIILLCSLSLFLFDFVHAQIIQPVKWSFAAKKVSTEEAVVFIKADILPGWHVYSQHIDAGGPVATAITFAPSKAYQPIGAPAEPEPIRKYEDVFGMDVGYFEGSVVFQQRIRLKVGQPTVKGMVEFMVCNDQQCLPHDEIAFTLTIN